MTAATHCLSSPAYLLLSMILVLGPIPGRTASEPTADIAPATQSSETRKNEADEVSHSSDLVQLSIAKQAVAGIKTQTPVSSHYQSEMQASAIVVDIQPLLNLREQFFAAQTEYQSATAALSLVQQAIQRTQELYRNGVNSKRQVQEQQIAHTAAQTRVTSSQYRLQSINDNLTANWGNTLSSWAKENHHNALTGIINGQQALLLISLPAGHTLPVGVKEIAVDPDGERQTPQLAQWIANAPQGSELSQGETYFFRTSRAKLRTGMRLSAWIAKPDQTLTGFNVTSSAVIWHAGLATIYVKTAPEYFKRLSLSAYHPIAHGYFVADPLPANTEVVTAGAQTLLSYEFQSLIPAEDNDGDD